MIDIFDSFIIKRSKIYVNNLLGPIGDMFYFHQYNHALDVAYRAVELGKKEGLKNWELEMLALAGIFHDTGFIIQYDNNEYIGAKIAENFLNTIIYPKKRTKIIKNIIIATIIKKEPNNLYEEIIKDADLDNLGREDFFDKTNDLKKEIEIIKNIKIKDNDWYHFALDLAYKHRFYTKTENNERLLKKLDNIKKLENMVKKK